MGYVDDSLITGECIAYRGRIHWAIFLPGILLLPVVIGLIHLVGAMVARLTTEMAVTNKRVIMKTGWISRMTLEMQLSRTGV